VCEDAIVRSHLLHSFSTSAKCSQLLRDTAISKEILQEISRRENLATRLRKKSPEENSVYG
jgi:hypothetical protein